MKAETSTPKILIAGIGNVFLGDDAFGSAVARNLTRRTWPAGVRVVDFGIRGIDLAYALMDGCDVTILIDAVPRGGEPGTTYLMELNIAAAQDAADPAAPAVQTHGMDLASVFRLVESMGVRIGRLLLVGCEPTPLHSEHDMLDGLSPPVAGAVGAAVELIESVIDKLISGKPLGGNSRSEHPVVEKVP